jgi:ABC-type sugar transport system substrate-binding protein
MLRHVRNSSRSPPGKRRSEGTECRIALFTMADYEYFSFVREDCEQTARRQGFGVRVHCADNDSDKQISQIQACLREPSQVRPTVLIVWPVLEAALLKSAYAAARLGVGWVLLNRRAGYMAHLREEFVRLPIFSVGADQREIGRIQGRQFRAMLPGGGELLYIRGPLGTWAASTRFEGVQEIIRDTSIELVSMHSDWTSQGGRRAMGNWLSASGKRDLSKLVVGAQNDAMAMGARDALREAAMARSGAALAEVRVSGCDGAPNYGRRLVGEGKLAATVIMPSPAGRAVIELAGSLREPRARPAAEITLAPASFPDLDRLAYRPG